MIGDEQAKVALKALFRIAKSWGLDLHEEATVIGLPIDTRCALGRFEQAKI